ncbi:unnamed protein product, partial [Mesorhabditis belari]|uniref:Zinc finger C2HC5-type domain-containing protein n=1 Tax=Mesorhabditis belari TaxID=2138241 RepID=A0AAF3EU51_9BILA
MGQRDRKSKQQQQQQSQKTHGQGNALTDGNVVERLRPGRHLCNCQARIHGLIRNCLGCGKIICEQEGSGHCLTCGRLVCTKEEREILERGSRKSAELYKKLTGEELPISGAFSLTLIGRDVENAVSFRDRLLQADADTERRTRVNDLEGDCLNIDRNPYVTKEEREAILQRREELRRIRDERKRALVVDIDLEGKTARTVAADPRATDPAYDPVIRAILDKSESRKGNFEFNSATSAQWEPKGFVPKYANKGSLTKPSTTEIEEVCLANEEVMFMEVERQAYTIALPQPAACCLANGLVKYIRWQEDLHLKGPLYVCAMASATNPEEIDAFHQKYVNSTTSAPLDYSSGSIQGKIFLEEILTIKEFNDEIGSNQAIFGSGDFVLAFSQHTPLTISVPHIPPSEFFQLERSLREALTQVLS